MNQLCIFFFQFLSAALAFEYNHYGVRIIRMLKYCLKNVTHTVYSKLIQINDLKKPRNSVNYCIIVNEC